MRNFIFAAALLMSLAQISYAKGPVTHEIASGPLRAGMNCATYACALTSLTLRDYEFINNADHGRQGQVAIQLDGYGECWNPTLAGSSHDGSGATSSSVPLGYWTNGWEMAASTQAAYWSVTGGGVCPKGLYPGAHPGARLSRTVFHTRYTASPQLIGGLPHKRAVQVSVTIASEDTRRRVEAYTVYTPPDLSWVYRAMPDGSLYQPQWDPLNWGFVSWAARDPAHPAILSSPDGSRALSLVRAPGTTKACETGREYFAGHFPNGGQGTYAQGGSKLSIALTAGPACGGDQAYKAVIFVGTLAEVARDVRMYYYGLHQ